jgi:hypothetical protein
MSNIESQSIPLPASDKHEIMHWLEGLAQPHIDASGGKLVKLEIEKPRLAYHVKGTPIETAQIDGTAGNVNEKFPALQESLDQAFEDAPYVLPQLGEALRKGYNVGLYTDHGDLTDIAFVLTGVRNALGRKPRYMDLFEGTAEAGIVTSKIIEPVGLNFNPPHPPIPAEDALTWVAHHVWSSYPVAPSITELRKRWPAETKAHNAAMKLSLGKRQSQRGLLLALAPEGAKTKASKADPNTYVLNTVQDGTKSIMMGEGMLALFVAVSFEGDEPRVALSPGAPGLPPGLLTALKTPSDVDTAMTCLSETRTEITPVNNRKYVYLPKGAGATTSQPK